MSETRQVDEGYTPSSCFLTNPPTCVSKWDVLIRLRASTPLFGSMPPKFLDPRRGIHVIRHKFAAVLFLLE